MPAKSPNEFHWVDAPSISRAPHIPPEKWKEHKDEICRLYILEHMTLENVMALMKETHGFEPTKRQYIYQLKQWDVNKYNYPSCKIVEPCPAHHSTKRDLELSSEFSGQVMKRPRVYSKRTVHTLRDDLESASRRSRRQEVSVSPPNEETTYASDDVHMASESLSISQVHELKASGFIPITEAPIAEKPILNKITPKSKKTLKRIRNMKAAADFLFCVDSRCDAFTTYAYLYKRLTKFGAAASESRIASVKWACIRSATTLSQVEDIARHADKRGVRNNERQSWIADLENLMTHAQLAYSYHALGDKLSVRRHLKVVEKSRRVLTDHALKYPPGNHRSLDLLLYLHLILNFYGGFDQYPNITIPPLQKMDFQRALFETKPGPFEFSGGVMQNGCFRSCILWCEEKLRSMAPLRGSESGSWICGRIDDSPEIWTTVPGSYQVFFHLWDLWQNPNTPENEGSEFFLWSDNAEELMGISATELLAITCCMIRREAINQQTNSRDSDASGTAALPPRELAIIGVTSLTKMSEEDLAGIFLDTFVAIEIATHSRSPCTDERFAAREARSKFIQSKFKISLPDVEDWEDIAQHIAEEGIDENSSSSSSKKRAKKKATSHSNNTSAMPNPSNSTLFLKSIPLLPTLLGSSLSLSGLSSMKNFMYRKSKVMEPGPPACPPSMFITSSGRDYKHSMVSVDDLSHLMSSSMVLDPIKEKSAKMSVSASVLPDPDFQYPLI